MTLEQAIEQRDRCSHCHVTNVSRETFLVPYCSGCLEAKRVLGNEEWFHALGVESNVRLALATQLLVDVLKVRSEATLKSLSLDSLELVRVVTRLEDTYHIDIPNGDLDGLYKGTVGDVIEYVRKKVHAGNSAN